MCLWLMIYQLSANTPVVEWAKTAGGLGHESAQITSVDKNGNIFIAGTSLSNTFSFGNINLINSNTSYVTSYLAKYSPNGEMLWAKGGGLGNSYTIVVITNDDNGNTFISGAFHSPNLRLGNFTLTNSDSYTYGKVFVAKYDPQGNVLWAITTEIILSNGTQGMCTDKQGNLYIAGLFQDLNMTFGNVRISNAASPLQDIFLFKFDSNGNVLWGKSFGGASHDVARALSVDKDDNLIMAGVFKSPEIQFGQYSLKNTDTSANNVFITKLSSQGDVLWAKGLGGNGEEYCRSVAVDISGNSYICGYFNGIELNIGIKSIVNSEAPIPKSFLVKYDISGNLLWGKSSGKDGVDQFNTVATDMIGNVYVCGYFSSTNISYDNKLLTNELTTGIDAVIVKYKPNGDVDWAKNYGDSEKVLANSCSVDKKGNVFVTGDYSSKALYFDNNKLYNSTFQNQSSSYTADVFIVKLNQLVDSITSKYCSVNNTVILTVEDIGSKYQWKNHQSADTISGTSEFIVTNPIVGDKYSCLITLVEGGEYELSGTIVDYNLNADFDISILDCSTNTVQFAERVLSSHEPIEYKWSFGDGYESNNLNPTHSYQTAGKYMVKLEVTNPLSSCPDTISKEIEVFSPMSVEIQGDSLCCKGYTLTMRAVGAPAYLWSDGSTADTLVVNENSGRIWAIGIYGNDVCRSDTVFKTIKSAQYQISVSGYKTFCPDLSTTITATGAKDFFWSNGIQSDSVLIAAPGGDYWVVGQTEGDSSTGETIFIKKPGNYIVSGFNNRGCEKKLNFNVTESELPNTDFFKSVNVVDRKNNVLTVSVNHEPETDYVWEMGDGSSFSGVTHTHSYNVRNNQIEYIIRLTATNEFGCVSFSEQSVDVVPFIPNVFSPNHDGVNDIFVPDVDVLIIDRYGKTLYRGVEGWDGTFNGREVPQDTYFYYVYYSDKYGKVQTRKGSVALIRQ